MPRLKETEKSEIQRDTHQRLLAAAAHEFAQAGFMGANINHISLSAGFAKGTIYNYFDSKHALMLTLIQETAVQHMDFIRKNVLPLEDPSDRLIMFFRAGFDFVNQHLEPGLVMVNTLYGPDDEFKQALYQAYTPMFQFVGVEILAPGITQGHFRPVEIGATAGLIMTFYLGTGSQVGPDGKTYLDPSSVADFVMHALKKEN